MGGRYTHCWRMRTVKNIYFIETRTENKINLFVIYEAEWKVKWISLSLRVWHVTKVNCIISEHGPPSFELILCSGSQNFWPLPRSSLLWHKSHTSLILDFVISGKIFVPARLFFFLVIQTCDSRMELTPDCMESLGKIQNSAAWLLER
jgi:hypothetical protein